CGPTLNWARLLRRFGPHWRVLLRYPLLFGYIYPSPRDRIPPPGLDGFLGRLQKGMTGPPPAPRGCPGTFLSQAQFVPDIERWGFLDVRFYPGRTAAQD